jgi:hypothetical protein
MLETLKYLHPHTPYPTPYPTPCKAQLLHMLTSCSIIKIIGCRKCKYISNNNGI